VLERGAGSGTGRRARTVSTRALVATAVGISVIAMAGMTAKAVITKSSCTRSPLIVNLAVSNDIAPAINTIANSFNRQYEVAASRCVSIEVTQGDSSAVAAQIDGQASLQTAVDAWIPDSSLWVDVARSYPMGAQVIQPTGISVARSPIMLVTTAPVAAETGIFNDPASWGVLLPSSFGGPPGSASLSVDMPDPADSSVGLSTLIEVSRALGYTGAGRAGLTKYVYQTEPTEDFDSASALASFAQSTGAPFYHRAITEASEQAVIAYDRAYPKHPLAARYPTSASKALGTPELDYPYVITSTNSAMQQAATAFGKFLQGSYAQSVVRYDGFRSANGQADTMPAGSGLSSQSLELATPPSASVAATTLTTWQKLGLGTRALAIIDDSQAMGAPSGLPSTTLETLLTQTAARGLALFPDTTQMGLWEAPDSQTGAADKSLVSVGPLPAQYGLLTRREQIQKLDMTLTPTDKPLHLYDAILAGYQQMTASYAANYSNAVIVLTAGIDASGDMSLNALLDKLRSLVNPQKRVEIVILQFGTVGNFTAMREVADATGGAAYQIVNPLEVSNVFIYAIAHTMCAEGCAAP
jgi:Ca-activated chloride channel homolog